MKVTALVFLALPALLNAGPRWGGGAAVAGGVGNWRVGAASAAAGRGLGFKRRKRDTVEDEIADLESRLSDLYNYQGNEAVIGEGEFREGRGIFDTLALRAGKAYGRKRCRIVAKELSGKKLAIFKSACKAVDSASSLDELRAIVYKAAAKICPKGKATESGKGAELDAGCRQVADYAADN